jgi:hypothetical protein
MESLPAELAELIVTSITDPRDAGRLRRVNRWWRDCVNEFAVALQFDTESLVPWEYLRNFKHVQFNGCLEVRDPADLDLALKRHAIAGTGLMLVVPPEKRATWIPQISLQSPDQAFYLKHYSGVLHHKLTDGYRVGYIRSYSSTDNESVNRLQELDRSRPVYVYYRGLGASGQSMMTRLIWLLFSRHFHDNDNHVYRVSSDRLKRESVDYIIHDTRSTISSYYYQSFHPNPPKITNGWITYPWTSSHQTIQPEYIQQFTVTDHSVKEIETPEYLQFLRQQLRQALIKLFQELGIGARDIYAPNPRASSDSFYYINKFTAIDAPDQTNDAADILDPEVRAIDVTSRRKQYVYPTMIGPSLWDSHRQLFYRGVKRVKLKDHGPGSYISTVETPEGSQVGIIKPVVQSSTRLHRQSEPLVQPIVTSHPKTHLVPPHHSKSKRPRWTKYDLKGRHQLPKNPTPQRFRYR